MELAVGEGRLLALQYHQLNHTAKEKKNSFNFLHFVQGILHKKGYQQKYLQMWPDGKSTDTVAHLSLHSFAGVRTIILEPLDCWMKTVVPSVVGCENKK